MNMISFNGKDLIHKEKEYVEKFAQTRKSVFHRYPLLFTLLVTFGFVATLYGFEGMIDRVAFLKEHPSILVLLGLAVLAFTGQLYRRLGR